MADQLSTKINITDFLLYESDSGKIRLEVYLQDETIWLSQKQMAELFGVDRTVITKHLNNIYADDELDKNSTSVKIAQVQKEGNREVSRQLEYYNLDAIIAVGYRVNSKQATQFRIWATRVLKEYIIKGFVMDDERLKQGKQVFGQDYFDELLERVRSIRASERRVYQKITDIFAEVCLDYDKHSSATKNFYAMVQNKFHYAITGKTAAEIISTKADSKSPYMGLTTFKNAPKGRVLASDVTVVKNYLEEKEIKRLERTISGFLDYIENVLENRTVLKMVNMAEAVDKFLSFNEFKVLTNKGQITKQDADTKALFEYDEFNKTQNIESDFDRMVKGLGPKS